MDWVGWDLKVIQFQQDRDTSQQIRLLQAAPSLTLNTPRGWGILCQAAQH